jgi:hypothetical protein
MLLKLINQISNSYNFRFGILLFNTTFTTISVIWWSALLVDKTRIPGRKPPTVLGGVLNHKL